MVIKLVIDYAELVKVALKESGVRKGVGGWVKRYGCCCILWPLCVFGCISIVVMEGVCIRDCRVLGLCVASQQVVSV
jgi:hypothetical protein